MAVCQICKGSGYKECNRCGGIGKMAGGERCYYCKGEKQVFCEFCNGKGYYDKDE